MDSGGERGEGRGKGWSANYGRFRTFRPNGLEELVTKKLRPGDIYTHLYLSSVPMLDDSGKLRSFLAEARKRGVIFDVGHGGGSFLFRQAVPAMKQGLFPTQSRRICTSEA